MKSLDTYPHFSFILIVRNNLPSNINLFKVSNRNTRKRYEKCSKLTKKCQNDVNDLVLVFLFFWTYFTPFSSVSVFDFEQVSVSWVYIRMILEFLFMQIYVHILVWTELNFQKRVVHSFSSNAVFIQKTVKCFIVQISWPIKPISI